MLEKGDLITLSNKKEYIVLKQLIFNGINYIYLISKDGISGFAICSFENDTLTPINDIELLQKLIKKFQECENMNGDVI